MAENSLTQGSLTVSLGIRKPDELDVSLATVMQNVIEGKDYLPDEGILHHKEGMDLLPSNIELSGLETALFNVMSRETILSFFIISAVIQLHFLQNS